MHLIMQQKTAGWIVSRDTLVRTQYYEPSSLSMRKLKMISRLFCTTMFVAILPSAILAGKPNRAESLGGYQRFSFGDHLTDGITSDFQGQYESQKGKDGAFSAIYSYGRDYADFYSLETDGSNRTMDIDFSQVIEGDASRLPASGFYEFRMRISIGDENGYRIDLTSMLAGEIRSGKASVSIYSPNDDRYYTLRTDLIIEAVDSNQNSVVDTFHVESTGPTEVHETLFLTGPIVENGVIGLISAPFSGTIVDSELP